jgi:tellurite resistance protein TerC
LRALYFLLVGLLDRLVHLHYGLAIVLAFIGVKLVLHYGHTVNSGVPEISTGISLLVVLVVLIVTTVTSLRASRNATVKGDPTDHEATVNYPIDARPRTKIGEPQ